ncbi:unnamed protein product [Protopolystoma xenopodis]|uniref:Uncharacterized protein n=1 Tax=Protopolystoma xenopodis TaxID=117903 RepID=A0A448XHQ7_9PLAT|nr:unnamed protein product [Protopolystoma xenopodis]
MPILTSKIVNLVDFTHLINSPICLVANWHPRLKADWFRNQMARPTSESLLCLDCRSSEDSIAILMKHNDAEKITGHAISRQTLHISIMSVGLFMV